MLKKGVTEQETTDWLRVRKEKKLTPTRAAIDAIEKEAISGNIDLPQAIHLCCENAWAGFKVSWLAKANGDVQNLDLADDWKNSASGIMAKGKSLGLEQHPGEAFPLFKIRVIESTRSEA